jgi:hypothetical protein
MGRLTAPVTRKKNEEGSKERNSIGLSREV